MSHTILVSLLTPGLRSQKDMRAALKDRAMLVIMQYLKDNAFYSTLDAFEAEKYESLLINFEFIARSRSQSVRVRRVASGPTERVAARAHFVRRSCPVRHDREKDRSRHGRAKDGGDAGMIAVRFAAFAALTH
jgi:hypothetical protein